MHRPITSITTNDKHFATCLLKLVDNCAPIPTIYQNISIQNPKNVDAFNLCWYLETYYSGIFDTSYNIRKNQWITQKSINQNQFNYIDQLTIHIYNDAIQERKEERSMKGVHMISFQNMNLHSLADYLKAMQAFANVPSLKKYLLLNVASIVADWPRQLFIRMAITHLHLQGNQSVIPSYVHNFVPILGPLHVSLNFREKAIMLYHNFFENLFHFVFGSKKTFAKKPKPWRINLILELTSEAWKQISKIIMQKFMHTCKDIEYRTLIDLLDNIIPATLDIYALLFRSGSFEEYIETIFRLWTFALKWRRKNYNKAPLAFLSDYFYWKDNKHPMAEALKLYLVNFNDYIVENLHSKIRANTNTHDSVESIITQAYIIGKREYLIN
jgi:hypothetical protein